MKTLKAFLILSILAFVAYSCTNNIAKSRAINPERVAIVYTADNANSITGAAFAQRKYAHNTIINVDNMTAANQLTAIQAITDSVHRVLLLVDTSTVFATNKLTGANYDSLVERMYTTTAYETAPDAAPTYYQATATANLAEVAWADLFSTYTLPLIGEYQGGNVFSSLVSRTRETNSDSSAIDSTNTLVVDAYDGDWIYIYSGTGIGQSRLISGNNDSAIFVTPDWSTNPDETSLFKIKRVEEVHELFYDLYSQFYVLTYLSNLSNGPTQDNWGKLFDKNNNLNDGNVHYTPYQDLDYLNNTVLSGGKHIFDYSVTVTDQ
jgi:hypothetical protein